MDTSKSLWTKKHPDSPLSSSRWVASSICEPPWAFLLHRMSGAVILTGWLRASHGVERSLTTFSSGQPLRLNWTLASRKWCSDAKICTSPFQRPSSKLTKFAGCVVSFSGVTPDPDRISVLANFPTSTDQTSVRSFLGLCNQLAFFLPDYQHHTVALRQLTGKGRSFLWLPKHQVEFDTLNLSFLAT